jgi:hypothetical protein
MKARCPSKSGSAAKRVWAKSEVLFRKQAVAPQPRFAPRSFTPEAEVRERVTNISSCLFRVGTADYETAALSRRQQGLESPWGRHQYQ